MKRKEVLPQYHRSGELLGCALATAPASSTHSYADIGVAEASPSGPPCKWTPEGNIIPQQLFARIISDGYLTLNECVELVRGQMDASLDVPWGTMDGDAQVELLPRRLGMIATKDGKVLTMRDAGIQPTDAVSLDVATMQSATLFGRDRSVVDVPIDHPSCSGQHAVMANRLILCLDDGRDADRGVSEVFDITFALMDLTSTHGTFVNHKRIPPSTWIPLREGDKVVFGKSTRTYVIVPQTQW